MTIMMGQFILSFMEHRQWFTESFGWMSLVALGAFHGINPGMGWLFAVALGMQEGNRTAVLRAMLPLGLGHALAIIPAVTVAMLLGKTLPMELLQWTVAVVLVGLGVMRFVRHRHPRWARMRVGMKGLTWWSFLMASAHGAGLMVVPIFLGLAAVQTSHACHTGATAGTGTAVFATVLHSAGYLAITALAAWVVYEKLGLGMLRKAWFNLDIIWAVALITTGAATLLI
jgi:hypothetical protein